MAKQFEQILINLFGGNTF